MAYTTIDNPELYFQTKLYVGNGSTNAITLDGSENMQPDWTWIKNFETDHANVLVDAVRGVTKELRSNGTNAEITTSNSFTSFDSDGFTLGADSTDSYNKNSNNFVSWNWKESATAGFDIVSYTGNGSNRTISHSLSGTPELMLMKRRDSSAGWIIYIKDVGAGKYLRLNTSDAEASDTNIFNNTDPTASVFSVGTDTDNNGNSSTYINYLFKPVQGYSAFGKYFGNGDASNSTYIHLGFRPAFFFLKKISASGEDWRICDNKRDLANVVDRTSKPNLAAADADADVMDFCSNGVKLRSSDGGVNGSGSTYIYIAFAESPFVNSNGVPNNAR